jgi:MOSC domain-containing protein YiiM
MRLGKEALVEVTQIGKECHDRCAIYHQVGDCVMPREGIFARVIKGGSFKPGDLIQVLSKVETPIKTTHRLGANRSIKHVAAS